ncbi:MAG: HD domain-containing protein [Lachnospiraceae bacterium]|nr:HD domain-containing protein [Lachnospiraceae bacterium]
MIYQTFAAIDVGSGELACKIFEVNKKTGIHEVDYVRHAIPLGAETFKSGKISSHTTNELCDVLSGFVRKMEEYGTENYVANATSAIREAANNINMLEQVKLRTGLKVKILSNSEQRFLYYKAMAAVDSFFEKVANEETLIIDVGAGSIQITLMSEGSLKHTQNIDLGFLRVGELLAPMQQQAERYPTLIAEYMNNDLTTFNRMFMGGKMPRNLISLSDHLSALKPYLMKEEEKPYLSSKKFLEFCKRIRGMYEQDICNEFNLNKEQVRALQATLIIYERICQAAQVERIWLSNATLCDGIAVDYSERKDKVTIGRDFTGDILSTARYIAQRYQSNTVHTDQVEYLATAIFDAVAKPFGLGKRDRLMLRLAAILHTCGEFVNMNKGAEFSYEIIMGTEILGLSHKEREMVANIVRYGSETFPRYESVIVGVDRDTYLEVAKLTAIHRLANIMDKSHTQKFSDVRVTLKGDKLNISVATLDDMTLERGLFEPKAVFFEEVFGILPVLKQKRKA